MVISKAVKSHLFLLAGTAEVALKIGQNEFVVAARTPEKTAAFAMSVLYHYAKNAGTFRSLTVRTQGLLTTSHMKRQILISQKKSKHALSH